MAWTRYWHFLLSGVFPEKVTPGIHFNDEMVVHRNVLVVKLLLHVMVIYK